MKPRRKTAFAALTKPSRFPASQEVEGWDTARLLAEGSEFEQYRFVGCDFGDANLSRFLFADCLFERCNLSSAQLSNAGLQNVAFAECKLLGVQFSACRDMLFGVHFDHCNLGYTSFAGKKMPGTRFAHCSLPEADFTNADLSEAVFAHCSLANATFHDTQLTGADFSTAGAFTIDPEANQLLRARFALSGLPGLLAKYGLIVE
ncbi:pentapeptide repeat-containing protein [Hymenobacter saemangeumensis]|uniref:Pentapeptide repeat-containing protein n=1 Tax=Hymenobacter saemangeumensis TaxID=1084522 RepID=A0ABP8I7J0_9BACT